MNEADGAVVQHRTQSLESFLGRGHVADLAFADQRADPVGLPPVRHGAAQVRHDLVDPRYRHQRGRDRRPSRRLFIQHRHVHVAVLRKAERARDRRGGHHQNVCGRAFGAQFHPLRHPEPVLFVDHG